MNLMDKRMPARADRDASNSGGGSWRALRLATCLLVILAALMSQLSQ